jgi:hypothetical protein
MKICTHFAYKKSLTGKEQHQQSSSVAIEIQKKTQHSSFSKKYQLQNKISHRRKNKLHDYPLDTHDKLHRQKSNP